MVYVFTVCNKRKMYILLRILNGLQFRNSTTCIRKAKQYANGRARDLLGQLDVLELIEFEHEKEFITSSLSLSHKLPSESSASDRPQVSKRTECLIYVRLKWR